MTKSEHAQITKHGTTIGLTSSRQPCFRKKLEARGCGVRQFSKELTVFSCSLCNPLNGQVARSDQLLLSLQLLTRLIGIYVRELIEVTLQHGNVTRKTAQAHSCRGLDRVQSANHGVKFLEANPRSPLSEYLPHMRIVHKFLDGALIASKQRVKRVHSYPGRIEFGGKKAKQYLLFANPLRFCLGIEAFSLIDSIFEPDFGDRISLFPQPKDSIRRDSGDNDSNHRDGSADNSCQDSPCVPPNHTVALTECHARAGSTPDRRHESPIQKIEKREKREKIERKQDHVATSLKIGGHSATWLERKAPTHG